MIDDDVQVVQCPSCGVCYKVTQKRQLMSLQKRQFSAVSVSPLTKFWCAVWALLGFGFLFGERAPTTSRDELFVAEMRTQSHEELPKRALIKSHSDFSTNILFNSTNNFTLCQTPACSF